MADEHTVSHEVGSMDAAEALRQQAANGQYSYWPTLSLEAQYSYLLNTEAIQDWTTNQGYAMLAQFRHLPQRWLTLKIHARTFRVGGKELEEAVDAWIAEHAPSLARTTTAKARPHAGRQMPWSEDEAWRNDLVYTLHGEPKQTAANISLVLDHHHAWKDRLWFDVIRGRAMLDDTPLSDDVIMDVMRWLQIEERLPTTMHKLVERCVVATCHQHPRDLLQTMLYALPPWDQTPRLETWLMDIGGVSDTRYTRAVSHLLMVSMVARVMDPGCLYRFVVILEGPEEYRKSTLVEALCGKDWYISLAIGLETKESHMMLQGAWVAEMPELDSLSRTEETRLKAFITMREDAYIPKYSNFRTQTPRRTIFVGTTNEESYLKGQTGNTRFLPLTLTHAVDMEAFHGMREQLLAEALQHYGQHTADWWEFPQEALEEARAMREARRMQNVYEDPLSDWLEIGRFQIPVTPDGVPYFPTPGVTTWQEIAQYFLKLDTPERWKDAGLQRQISAALRAIGWAQKVEWDTEIQRSTRIWRKKDAT
jgi:virulence-associated protein E